MKNKSPLEILQDALIGKTFMRSAYMDKDERSIVSVIKSIEVGMNSDYDAKLFLTFEDSDEYEEPTEIYFNEGIELEAIADAEGK